MEKFIISPAEQKVTRWSGGETRELYITGGAANYAARDFSLRLSSATVETDTSDFTALPGISRALMPLDNTIELVHDDGEPIRLAPFAVDYFSGGVATVSRGRCRDFNVMWREGAPFSVALTAPPSYPATQTGSDADYYYAYHGDFIIEAGGERILLEEGALLGLGTASEINIRPALGGTAQIIHVAITKIKE